MRRSDQCRIHCWLAWRPRRLARRRRGLDRTLFSVEITTGRSHQIRIHLACAGHPLIGDPLYVAGGALASHPGLPGDDGYLLHAEYLRFAHPITGHAIQLHAPPPVTLWTSAEASLPDAE